MNGYITAVLIGGPRNLTQMTVDRHLNEIRVMLAANLKPVDFSRSVSPDTFSVTMKVREAIYRAEAQVRPVHGEETRVYVYQGERE